MKKIYLLLLLFVMSLPSFATFYTPSSAGTGFSGPTALCLGATASPVTFNYAECASGTGAATGVACSATWYYNTSNSTAITGSTVMVSGPTSFTSAAGMTGDLPGFTPSTAATGIRYYFCVVTWSTPGACGSPYVTPTRAIVVNPTPVAITGTGSLCIGASATYTDASPGGMSWTSSNSSVASVGIVSGVVTGVGAGTANITFTLSTGCYTTKIVTVNAAPATITSTANPCIGTSTTLTDADAGGTWVSNSTSIATIGSSSGIVTGVAAGTSVITYTLPTGCKALKVVTVNSVAAIAGVTAICEGISFPYTDATTGGTWSSSNSSVATVSTSGTVTGVLAGTANILYTAATGCVASKTVTINPTPAAIGGSSTVCVGSSTTLTDATSSGTWASGNVYVASITGGGVVTGTGAGTANITYALSSGCRTTATITVNAIPAVISGALTACTGSTSTVTNTTGGGTWSATPMSVATIGSADGVVSAITAGTATVTYTLGTGCYRTSPYTVKLTPAAIAGTLAVCPGTSTALSDPTPTGISWGSSATGVATISGGGIATGISAGTSTITYTTANGCYNTAVLTVNPTPATFTGTMKACLGLTSMLSDADAGGTWTSSNIAIASVGSSSGVVTGNASGTATVSYTLPTGCIRTGIFTVNPLPAAISGASTVCAGTTATLTDATTGGTWMSSNTSAATVGTSGIVTGIAAGVTNITYTLATGCTAVQTVTVISAPPAITGTTTVCAGATTTLSNTATGGTWSSSNVASATVSATGVVTGVASGTANITYVIGAGCSSMTTVTVDAQPAVITGGSALCMGGSLNLANATSGGTWSSSATGVATIGSGTGMVTPVSAGTTTISYTIASGCYRLLTLSVNSLPGAIGGSTPVVCPGTTTTVTDATSGGTWSSSNTAIATVSASTGIITGVTGGNATIIYTLPTGCSASTTATVNPSPAAITGTPTICISLTSTLADATSGGTWTSGSPSVATVGSSTGVVTGVSGGNADITYTIGTGCYAIKTVTIVASPAAITGTTTVCAGFTSTLADASVGGTWSSSNTAIATIGTSGILTGVSGGPATITYSLGGTCVSTTSVSVNTTTPITGTAQVCVGSTTTLGNATTGGTWASSSTGTATVGASSGIVTGVAAGTVNITYTPTSGCATYTTVTVNALPSAITGTTTACAGVPATLTNASGAGTWTSSATGIATVGSSSGVVTGVAAGTATITYTAASNGCVKTTSFTVKAIPVAITGASTLCTGSSTTYTDATTGGSGWASSNTSVATIGALSGVATGMTAGTTIITFTLATGCYNTKEVTVNAAPASIVATANPCVGTTTTLTNTDMGGIWASSNMSVATIASATGVVTGIAPGTSLITYTLATGCRSFAYVTVNSVAAVTGVTTMCPGVSFTFTNATTGGTWSSSNTSVATVGTSGIVTGVVAGTANIQYTAPNTCVASKTITINAAPASISGPSAVCAGSTISLTDASSGGTWASSNMSVATVNASGIVSGISAGNATITYTLSTGCTTFAALTVNPLPATITGTTNTCIGLTSTLGNATTGGTWASSSSSFATIGSGSGVVTGVTDGIVTVTYTLPTGCYRTTPFTVKPTPVAIGGTATVCVGLTTTLTDATSGGVSWSSSTPAVATVGSLSGVVTGVAAGNSTITYTISNGCFATKQVTVNPSPGSITGIPIACVGSTTTLDAAPASGTWSSSNTGVFTVGSTTGIVTGVSAGTAVVTYSEPSSCISTFVVTINTVPAITGASTVCEGSVILLDNAATGGFWSDDATGFATFTGMFGTSAIISGTAHGTSIVSYTSGDGCVATKTITVNELPGSFSDPMLNAVCPGTTVTVTAMPSGGTWSSGDMAIATVGSATGIVTGVAAGNVDLTYTAATGCAATTTATVNPLPASITGNGSLCVGLTNMLSTASTGGTWSSANTSIATAGTTGAVTGIATGTTTIYYTLSTGCRQGMVVTVNPDPAAITGTASMCQGSTTTLSDGTPGGVSWSSSDATVASVGSLTGVITGNMAGNATITYTLFTGCYATKEVTVNALPSAISGTLQVCEGLTTTLSATPTSNTWSSSNASVATVGAASGVVSGVTSGTATITYTIIATGCTNSAVVTVNPLPASITGNATICVGSTSTLSTASTGGTWTSGSANATVNSSTGMVTGAMAGTAIITYTLPTGCITTRTVTVLASPAAITGTQSVCVGSATTLSNTTTGGSWSSSNTAKASVGSATGLVIGIASGTSTITYSFGGSCFSTAEVTVNAIPAAITGTLNVCIGGSQTLSDGDAGGNWTSSAPSVATINSSTGLVSSVSAGTTTVSYTLAGCSATAVFTVNPMSSITGIASACVGFTTTLANATTGGTWSSSNMAVGTVGTSGVVSGISAGNTTISYIIASTGCFATREVTVSTFPSAIGGSTSVCTGLTTTLTNTATGGVWTSSNGVVATIGSSTGVVTGVSAGTSNITYTIGSGTGCRVFTTVTDNSLPAGITGLTNACVGSTSTLSNGTSGGTWTSSNASVASVGSMTGVVTAVSAGTVTISYTLSTGCFRTTSFTSKSNPTANVGTPSICIGSSVTFTNGTSGGTGWTSSDAAIASVGAASGIVTGVAAGNANITYNTLSGCYAVTTVTVNIVPAAVTGTQSVCAGLTTTLNSTTMGGTWASSNTSIATVGSGTGVVTGVAGGTAFVTYALSTGCRQIVIATVNAVAAITGVAAVCEGSTTTLTDATSGGTWLSSATGTATIGTSGIVSGIAAGNANITYTSPAGCQAFRVVTVNVKPTTFTGGSGNVCVGSTTPAFASTPAGGTWTSASNIIATVGTSGAVTGASGSGGTVNIYYTLTTGCQNFTTVTVNPLPATITGTLSACVGETGTALDATSGGTWSASNMAVGTVNSSTGVVTGISAGTTLLTYTVTSTGCYKTNTFIVNPLPTAIYGSNEVCVASSVTLFDTSAVGLSWTSSTPAVATVGSISGVVTGVTAGTSMITYTMTTGCKTTKAITVNPLPDPVMGGAGMVCEGSVTPAFTNATPGGTWVSGSTSIATVGSASGIATGVGGGTVFISYTLTSTGCATTAAVTVNSNSPITGTPVVCEGAVATLTDISTGGTWSSTNTAKVTIDASGNITGVAAGTSTISYYNSTTGCLRTVEATVNPVPAAISPVGGSNIVCQGFTLDLDDATPSGTWSGSNSSIATIGSADGLVTGVTNGGVIATYTLPTTCYTTLVVVVNANAPITGTQSVCVGATTTLNDLTAGGTWSSTMTGNATVDPSSGIVTGVAAGTSNISYLQANACYRIVEVTVNALPTVYAITNAGGTGTAMGLSGSQTGVNYELFKGGISQETVAGTGTAFDFASMSSTGTDNWTAVATNTVTGCTENMTMLVARPNSGATVQGVAFGDVAIYPNPNSGIFSVKGTLGTQNVEVSLEITDVLGQVIYKNNVTAPKGAINEKITLDNTLANGMYILNLRSGNDKKLFHFVVQQ